MKSLRLLFVCFLLAVPALAIPPGRETERIAVDQFGYLPTMKKFAVISDPQAGLNAEEEYQPGPMFEVRRWLDHSLVLRGAPVAWKNGAVHDQSGDKVWWFDFSALDCEGSYYIYDPQNDRRSFVFRISRDVYAEVLKAATRMFFYQRCAMEKKPPFTDPRWADDASHLQDRRARSVAAQNSAATEKDLSGGWFDAGDYNKYVNFTTGTLQNLLFAYRRNPSLFTDDFNIPESGNGVPDLLDEIKWELDWLLRMQQPDGSVLSKVSVTEFQGASPASRDATPRFYGPVGTSTAFSATISFANAAIAYAQINPAYAAQLRAAALKAWQWGVANPNVVLTNQGFNSAASEVDAYGRGVYKLAAAIHLYALTGEAEYKQFVEANYQNAHALQWTYWYGFEGMIQDALIYYTSLPGISDAVAAAIKRSKQNSMDGASFLRAYTEQTDAYRAFLPTNDYTWGSNQTKSTMGLLFSTHIRFGVDPARNEQYRAAAAGFIHYLHGVNPLTMVQLTNMYAYGAEKSASEMYHTWMGDRTEWDNALSSPRGPAPGYVMGGANPTFVPDTAYRGPVLSPPMNQPTQKAYKDWNTSWPENSWQITEPAIYYQAAYINLLADVIGEYQSLPNRSINLACRVRLQRISR